MPQQPTLQTERLLLRPFTLEDAPDGQRLAGDRAIAATTEYEAQSDTERQPETSHQPERNHDT